jgi:hypothetical protein
MKTPEQTDDDLTGLELGVNEDIHNEIPLWFL